jgi:hypothetical protein
MASHRSNPGPTFTFESFASRFLAEPVFFRGELAGGKNRRRKGRLTSVA